MSELKANFFFFLKLIQREAPDMGRQRLGMTARASDLPSELLSPP